MVRQYGACRLLYKYDRHKHQCSAGLEGVGITNRHRLTTKRSDLFFHTFFVLNSIVLILIDSYNSCNDIVKLRYFENFTQKELIINKLRFKSLSNQFCLTIIRMIDAR